MSYFYYRHVVSQERRKKYFYILSLVMVFFIFITCPQVCFHPNFNSLFVSLPSQASLITIRVFFPIPKKQLILNKWDVTQKENKNDDVRIYHFIKNRKWWNLHCFFCSHDSLRIYLWILLLIGQRIIMYCCVTRQSCHLPKFYDRLGSTRGTGFQTHSKVSRAEGLNPWPLVYGTSTLPRGHRSIYWVLFI